MDLELITNTLASDESGEEFLQALDARILDWLSDDRLDAAEMEAILSTEKALRSVIETRLVIHDGQVSKMVEEFPGSPYVVMSWVRLANLVFMNGVTLNPLNISDEARAFIGHRAAIFVMHVLIGLQDLESYTTAKAVASLIYLKSDKSDVAELVKKIQANDPDFADRVWNFVLELDESYAEFVQNEQLLTMTEYFNEILEPRSKTYKRLSKGASADFMDQRYLASMLVTDYDLNGVHLLFGNQSLLIANEKRGFTTVRRDQVRGIVLGTRTERMHTGFSHTDYHKWTIDIHTSSGSVHQFTATLGTNNEDLNPRRETLTRDLGKIEKFYPVTSSGRHSVGEGGYRTTMSYWF